MCYWIFRPHAAVSHSRQSDPFAVTETVESNLAEQCDSVPHCLCRSPEETVAETRVQLEARLGVVVRCTHLRKNANGILIRIGSNYKMKKNNSLLTLRGLDMMDWKWRWDEIAEMFSSVTKKNNPNELADPSFTSFGNTMTKPATKAPTTESRLMCRWLLSI